MKEGYVLWCLCRVLGCSDFGAINPKPILRRAPLVGSAEYRLTIYSV